VKLVHLVGFIIKKFVTIHGHMNVNKKLKEPDPCTKMSTPAPKLAYAMAK